MDLGIPPVDLNMAKYRLETIEGKDSFVPSNAAINIGADVSSSLISSFKQMVKISRHCENCGCAQTFNQHHYMSTTPEILILRVDKKDDDKKRLKINKLLFLDDIWIIDGKLKPRHIAYRQNTRK